MIHYGHSCLVPIDHTVASVKMLYVFVDIAFDTSHLEAIVRANFKPGSKLAILGTIQFASALAAIKTALSDVFPELYVPQAKPLSPGEVLGCTSPDLSPAAIKMELDALIFVADGRFHLESAMIHNPSLAAYRYDPYGKTMTREYYDTPTMMTARKSSIDRAASARTFGIVLGTLGRQGNPAILHRLQDKIKAAGKESFVLLLSELSPAKLALFEGTAPATADSTHAVAGAGEEASTAPASGEAIVDAWIQIACPRLSIDWSAAFTKPLLTPYEAEVCLGTTPWRSVYPMDFYAKGSGSWTNYYAPPSATGGAGSTGARAGGRARLRAQAAAAQSASAPTPGSGTASLPAASTSTAQAVDVSAPSLS